MKITENIDLDFTVYRSRDDGAIVIEIDHDPGDDERGIRINLNDGILYEGHVERDDSAIAVLAKISAEQLRTHKQQPENVAQSDADFRSFVWALVHEVHGIDSVAL